MLVRTRSVPAPPRPCCPDLGAANGPLPPPSLLPFPRLPYTSSQLPRPRGHLLRLWRSAAVQAVALQVGGQLEGKGCL